LAPAEPNKDTSESNTKIANKLTLPPGTVVLFAVFLSKNLTNSSSNSTCTGTTNKQAARLRTICTGNGSTTRPTGTSNSTNNETTTVEVEQEPLLNYANIDAPKLNIRAFDQTVSGQDRSVLASRKAKS
jgi:hypothetical protein